MNNLSTHTQVYRMRKALKLKRLTSGELIQIAGGTVCVHRRLTDVEKSLGPDWKLDRRPKKTGKGKTYKVVKK